MFDLRRFFNIGFKWLLYPDVLKELEWPFQSCLMRGMSPNQSFREATGARKHVTTPGSVDRSAVQSNHHISQGTMSTRQNGFYFVISVYAPVQAVLHCEPVQCPKCGKNNILLLSVLASQEPVPNSPLLNRLKLPNIILSYLCRCWG